MKRSIIPGLALLTAGLVAGCPKPPPTPPPPPTPATVVSFAASPAQVTPGETVVLSWDVEHASRVDIRRRDGSAVGLAEPGRARGSVEVVVEADEVFLLTARGDGGSDAAAAGVSVVAKGEQGALFAAIPDEVAAGDPVTLVWSVPGEAQVRIDDGKGNTVYQGEERASSKVVRPSWNEVYTLTSGSLTRQVEVTVRPVIALFSASPTAVALGEEVTLHWVAAGASRLVLSAEGRGELVVENDPSRIADGSFTETVTGVAAKDGVVRYHLQVESSGRTVEAVLHLGVGVDPVFTSLLVPGFIQSGQTISVYWQTGRADRLEVLRDGTIIHQAQSLAEVRDGSLVLEGPTTQSTLTFRAHNQQGGTAAQSRTIEAVGLPILNSFTATPTVVANGGDPVTLTWDVTNARKAQISIKDGRLLKEVVGLDAENGTIKVYPNGPTEYVLVADNQVGNELPPQSVLADVGNRARLTFSAGGVPLGTTIQLTGSTVSGAVGMVGKNFVGKNRPGDAFVSILATGTPLPVGSSDDTVSYLIDLPDPFVTSIGGTPVSSSTVSVSINGWMVFSPTTVTGPSVPGTLPATTIPPLSIAPYFKDLQADGNTKVLWQLDGAGLERRLIVQWDDNRYFASTTKRVTFQAQVYQSGKIVFAYSKVAGLLSTDTVAIGVQNHDGTGAVMPEPGMLTNTQPAAGDTFRFFGPLQLPYPVVASAVPLQVDVLLPDGGVVEIEDAPSIIPPGQFWISEANYNPAAGQAEWFEVANGTADPIDLEGWTIDFGGGQTHLLAGPLTLPPQGFLLFGQTPDAAEASAGGPAVDYVYGPSFALPDAAGSVSLGIQGGNYTRLAWTSAGTAGTALQADRPSPNLMLAAGVTSLSCPATALYGVTGQQGTPGASNTRCFPYDLQPAAPNGFEPIAATGTWVSGLTVTSIDAYGQVTLPRPVKIFGQPVSILWVSSNGFLTFVSITDSHYVNNTVVATTAPNGVLAPFWDDLQGQAGGTVMWQQFDPDGIPDTADEYTLVSWEGWKIWGSAFTSTVNFQVRFDEATGDIAYHYGAMVSSDAGGVRAKGSSATTWLENATGTAALVVNVDSATNPGLAPDTGFRYVYAP